MYSEVRDAISRNEPNVQKAVLLLVNELLADDSLFKDQLVTILLASPNTTRDVRKEQEAIETKSFEFSQAEKNKYNAELMTIDVFYLEEIIKEAKPRAEKIIELLKKEYPSYRIRLRLLPRYLNARSGYRIGQNEIRFEYSEEAIATKIDSLIRINKIFKLEQPKLKQIFPKTESPNYISIFIRNM